MGKDNLIMTLAEALDAAYVGGRPPRSPATALASPRTP